MFSYFFEKLPTNLFVSRSNYASDLCIANAFSRYHHQEQQHKNLINQPREPLKNKKQNLLLPLPPVSDIFTALLLLLDSLCLLRIFFTLHQHTTIVTAQPQQQATKLLHLDGAQSSDDDGRPTNPPTISIQFSGVVEERFRRYAADNCCSFLLTG